MLNKRSTSEDVPMRVVLEVPDQDRLRQLLEVIGAADVPAQTTDVTEAGLSPEAAVTIDLGVLTAKQREALELALERGYYERPRDATLSDLAELLGITKSAVSQRLRSAESKLVNHALGRHQ
jgi:predicted DNA binding protein